MKLIVRADYYPNGTIVPLCITDDSGISSPINTVLRTDKTIGYRGVSRRTFVCESSGQRLVLYLEENVWTGEWLE